jgi:Cdc6-like AAA superfamily ATPase
MAASVSEHPSLLAVPAPEANDSDVVSENLLAAGAELARGEPRQALRLLRQAAEACEASGDDLRALSLARSAADLANVIGSSLPPPPPVRVASAEGPREGLEPELSALLDSGRAVRVLVKRSARDEELYVVRRPVDGKPVYDAREAVIVLLEPDAHFFGNK